MLMSHDFTPMAMSTENLVFSSTTIDSVNIPPDISDQATRQKNIGKTEDGREKSERIEERRRIRNSCTLNKWLKFLLCSSCFAHPALLILLCSFCFAHPHFSSSIH